MRRVRLFVGPFRFLHKHEHRFFVLILFVEEFYRRKAGIKNFSIKMVGTPKKSCNCQQCFFGIYWIIVRCFFIMPYNMLLEGQSHVLLPPYLISHFQLFRHISFSNWEISLFIIWRVCVVEIYMIDDLDTRVLTLYFEITWNA